MKEIYEKNLKAKKEEKKTRLENEQRIVECREKVKNKPINEKRRQNQKCRNKKKEEKKKKITKREKEKQSNFLLFYNVDIIKTSQNVLQIKL